jgi:hypothetical protein
MTKHLWAAGLGFGIIFAGAAPVRAEFEVRLALGQNWVSPNDFNATQRALNEDLELETMTGGGVDVLFHPPVLPLMAGLRFERFGEKENSQDTPVGGYMWDVEVSRLSAVAGFRLLDTVVFLGPIATVGYPSGTIQAGGANPSENDLDRDGLSYSLGAEGGVVLRKWTLGAELGYESLKFKGLDLSGPYARVLVGRRFL